MATTQDYCVPIQIEVEQENFTINNLAVGLAFFFGFLFGLILLLICAKLCLKDFAKKKRQDVEEELMEAQGLAAHEKTMIDYHDSRPTSRQQSARAKSAAKKRLQSAKKGRKGEGEPLVPIVPVTLVENNAEDTTEEGEKGSKGLIDALVQPTPSAMEVEMVEQDVDAVNALERELKEESIMTMIQLMRTLLGQQMQKGKINQDDYKDIMKDVQDNIQETVKQIQNEKDDEEEEIKKKYAKDPRKRQAELDKVHSKYMGKMNSMLADEREKMRKHLQGKTDLGEKDIEAILAAYAKQMASMEHKLGVERARQVASLEERLAKRKQLAELQNMETDIKNKELDHRRETNEKMLKHLIDEGQLTEKQKEELLKQYDDDVNRFLAAQDKEYTRQKQSLADKLKRNREEKMQRLREQQEKEQENFTRHSDKLSGGDDVVEAYHNLLQQQREQREELNDELDQTEADEIMQLKKASEKEQSSTLDESDEKLHKDLQLKGITDREMDRLLRIHEQEKEQFEGAKKAEKKKMKARLEEKLAKRRLQAEEDQALALAEAQAVKEQQDATIKKVLDNQVELSPDAREQILKEHEQNMTVINNQLQMSKLRQKKAMEAKMAARKAKVDELKKKKEDLKRNKRNLKEKENEKLQAQLDKQIADEEMKIEEERKNALNELRKAMAEETDAALKEQEKQMSVLIARLQVGQARRQAIISKQDKAIKELEDKLANKVEPTGQSNQQVDYLLQEHYRQVSDLNTQMQDVKDRQEQILRDKLESKRLMKEREIEDKLETEAQQEWQDQKKRGALISTSILSQVMLEQRHKMEIKRLEKEMGLEMQKQREKLNDELEEELKRELEERKKSFLAQVAAISSMSKDDVNDLVDHVVEGSAKPKRQGYQNEAYDGGYERPRSGKEARRPKSGKANYFDDDF